MLWPTMPFYTLHPLVGKKITVEKRCVYACVWMYIVWLCCDCVASSFYLLRPWARQRVYSATVKKKYWHRSNFQHTSQSILSRKVMIILQFWRPWALERIYCDACMYECVCVCVCACLDLESYFTFAPVRSVEIVLCSRALCVRICVCVCVCLLYWHTQIFYSLSPFVRECFLLCCTENKKFIFSLFAPVSAGMFFSVQQ